MRRILLNFFLCAAAFGAGPLAHAAPDHVDITWMSITNMHFALGKQQILADGYITRLPQEVFFGGATGVASTHRPMRPDVAAVTEVFEAIGGKSAVNLLLTGHSHFDHSFDTATWARLSDARIIGSPTTCLQVRAAKIPASRCTPVFGGEKFTLETGVDMYVIRWNHSGDPAKNGEQHDPLELRDVPKAGRHRVLSGRVSPKTSRTAAGIAPICSRSTDRRGNSAGCSRTRPAPSICASQSSSTVRNFGAPLDNLRAAMQAARLESVDLWIATGGRDVAALVLPILKPKPIYPFIGTACLAHSRPDPRSPMPMPRSRPCSRRAGCGRSSRCNTWIAGGSTPRECSCWKTARSSRSWVSIDAHRILGLGNMGSGMAGRLLAAGHSLAVFNRTAARAAPFEKLGARIADSPRSAALQADIIIGMTADDESSRAMWLGQDGALAADNLPDALAIECSTLSHDWVLELAAKVRARGFRYVDAPVTGLPDAAAAGTLTLLVGADAADLDAARPILTSLATRVLHFGAVGQGTVYKLMINLMGAVQIARRRKASSSPNARVSI
jgi:hypothetical protein